MKNIVLSTRNIDDFISDVANEVVKKMYSRNAVSPQKESQENPINIQEVANITGLSVPTLYGYCQKNKIPFSKKGKRNYFFKSEIIEWLKSGKQKTTDDIENDLEDFLSNKKGLKNGK